MGLEDLGDSLMNMLSQFDLKSASHSIGLSLDFLRNS